jgi:hypothetical protein
MSRPVFCVAVALATGFAGPALAQGFPVIDQAAVAEATDSLKAAAQQVQQLNGLLTQMQGIVQTVGKEGMPTLLFQEALSQSGISQFAPPVADLLESAQATMAAGQSVVGSFQSVLAQADQLKGHVSALGKKPDFSSFTSAQKWVKQELTVAANANATSIALTRKARSLLAGEAAANAYALALSARQQLSTMSARSRQLAGQASGATDLRGDMEANTAVMLAMHDEMAQIQALMAAVLEVQSAAHLAEMDPGVSASGAASATASTGP